MNNEPKFDADEKVSLYLSPDQYIVNKIIKNKSGIFYQVQNRFGIEQVQEEFLEHAQ